MHTGVTHVHISYTSSGPQTHQTPHWECPCSGGDIYQTVTVGWWSVGILPELENVFMEDVMGHLYNPPPLSLVSQWLSASTTSIDIMEMYLD